MDDARAMARESLRIAHQIGTTLHGRGPLLQGAILAELVSMWLASHVDEEQRRQALAHWIDTVHKLVSIQSAMIMESLETAGKG